MGLLQRGPDLGIAFRRAKSHDDVFRTEYGFHPRAKENRQIERGKCALADDHRMNEFDGDVLCVGGIRSTPKGQQTPPAKKSFRHFAASFCQATAPRE